MKTVCFWVLAMFFGLLTTQAAFAKPNDIHKIIISQKLGKPQSKGEGTQKNNSRIDGTTINHKH